MTETCSVLIAAADLLSALQSRASIAGGEIIVFTDRDPLRALEAIGARKPNIVVLERQFAATPRGAALINRIKADPSLGHTEIRVLAHDSDYSRVVPRSGAPAPAVSPPATPPMPAATATVTPAAPAPTAAPAAEVRASTATATEDRPTLDRGTRRAPRFRMAGNVDVLIDGNPAALVELSSIGAQVVSPTILKPNQRVRMVLTDDSGTIRVSASIAWAAFEIPTGGPQYRAGIEFVDPDPGAIDAFCQRHVA